MPKPINRKAPPNQATCAHQWVDTQANGIVVHRRCTRCRKELGIRPATAAPVAAAAPVSPAPAVPPRAIDPTLYSALEMATMYQTALETLITGNVASYTLPTGVTVTRSNMTGVENSLKYWRKEALRQANGMKSIAYMGAYAP